MACLPQSGAIALALVVLAAPAVSAAVTTAVVDVPTRNVTQRFLYVRPDAPVANVVSLVGGDGFLGIRDDGVMTSPNARCSPIARNRDAFAAQGIALALVDAASDGSVQEFDDVLEVVRYMQAHDNVPTWIVGGSSSTTAAWNMAVNLPASLPVGVVFFSPELVDASRAALIKRPTLVVKHALDGDPYSTASSLYSGLTSAPAKQFVTFTGGSASGCGYHLYAGLDADFVAATTGFVTQYNGAIASAAPDVDQHGLTGVWYEPATSGQGFVLESYPDLIRPGTAFIAGGWFAFDVASGGPDKQRWYSISGPMASGAASVPVTIYQNTGGNFDAPPATSAQPVGTGVLSFWTCDAAALRYSFADGRSGSIPLSRITSNVECSASTERVFVDDFGLSGNWFNPSTSGQGLVVEVNPVTGALFFAWYTYAPNAAASGAAGQRWYTAYAPYVAHARTIDATLYETAGGAFDVPTVAGQTTTAVGTATLAFTSCATATLRYSFTGGTSAGLAGTMPLQRAGPAPDGCRF